MKRLLLLILLLPILFDVNAQDHFLGVKGGVSWTDVSSGTIYQNANSLRRFSGGITYEYFVTDFISVGSGLSYDQRGFSGKSFLVTEETFYFTHSFDYLSLPIKVGSYTSNSSFFGFVKAGLVPSYLIHAKMEIPTVGEGTNFTGTQKVNVTGDVSAFDLAGLAELGGGYKASTKIWITASISYQHSLTSITNANFFAGENIRHKGVNVNLGLMYGL